MTDDAAQGLRAVLVQAINATPGCYAGPLIGPVMRSLENLDAQDANESAVEAAVRLALTGTGFEVDLLVGPLVTAVMGHAQEALAAKPSQQSVQESAASAVGTVHVDEEAREWGTDRYVVVPASGGAAVGPFDDLATAEHAAEDSSPYIGPGDFGAFRLELWIDGSGWNEGYDMVQEPVFVAYVATARDADAVMAAIERAPHTHAWTGFGARMKVADSGVHRRDATDIVGSWTAWIASIGPQGFIP